MVTGFWYNICCVSHGPYEAMEIDCDISNEFTTIDPVHQVLITSQASHYVGTFLDIIYISTIITCGWILKRLLAWKLKRLRGENWRSRPKTRFLHLTLLGWIKLQLLINTNGIFLKFETRVPTIFSIHHLNYFKLISLPLTSHQSQNSINAENRYSNISPSQPHTHNAINRYLPLSIPTQSWSPNPP